MLEGAEVALLHCVSAYPIAADRAALSTIGLLRERFRTTVGYSDHTLGLDACLTAAALGARILEKHFTLRRDFSDFRDHQLSAEPHELAELVLRVAAVEAMIGTPRAGVFAEEEAVAAAARRSPRAARALRAGHVLEPGDVTWLRPREGERRRPRGSDAAQRQGVRGPGPLTRTSGLKEAARRDPSLGGVCVGLALQRPPYVPRTCGVEGAGMPYMAPYCAVLG